MEILFKNKLEPKLFCHPNFTEKHIRMLVITYGMKKDENLSIPLKVYYFYSICNGYISSMDIAPKLDGNGDYFQEKDWIEIEKDQYTNKVIEVAVKTINNIKRRKEG